MVEGKRVAESVNAMIVPGSGIVKMQAEAEGLDKIFKAAGFDWREPGCSMCLAMNADRLAPHERCASTSNRNFEGRQGFKGRTHLVSPAMAAAAAIAGRFVDIRTWQLIVFTDKRKRRRPVRSPPFSLGSFSDLVHVDPAAGHDLAADARRAADHHAVAGARALDHRAAHGAGAGRAHHAALDDALAIARTVIPLSRSTRTPDGPIRTSTP